MDSWVRLEIDSRCDWGTAVPQSPSLASLKKAEDHWGTQSQIATTFKRSHDQYRKNHRDAV